MPVWETIHIWSDSKKRKNATFSVAYWFEIINSWWILKAARNCTQNILRIPSNTNSGKENSYWFKATKYSLLPGRLENKQFHQRAPSPLFRQAQCSAFPRWLSGLCPLQGAHKSKCSVPWRMLLLWQLSGCDQQANANSVTSEKQFQMRGNQAKL